jgi:hypothetical protein
MFICLFVIFFLYPAPLAWMFLHSWTSWAPVTYFHYGHSDCFHLYIFTVDMYATAWCTVRIVAEVWGCVIHLLECNPEINVNIVKDILHILQAMIEQNYFLYYYIAIWIEETAGLVMGAPTSLFSWNIYRPHGT